MPEGHDTIFGLSSGSVPSGVAVVRVSGKASLPLAEIMVGATPLSHRATLRDIRDIRDGAVIDRGLVLYFASPNSFTGEDCLEFHVHGGRAVVSRLFDSLAEQDGVRLAEAGEFTRRAFENGKLDLTAAEGLADLISAETEEQRKLALEHASGLARVELEGWRDRLIRIMAMYAAEIDFVEEDDVPEEASHVVEDDIVALADEISNRLEDRFGEIVHDGFRIAIMGKPNAGKSSLLNALAKRDVAIVTDVAGTTRDVLEVNLDINGYKVRVYDTAGIRHTEDIVEVEGIRRAVKAEKDANLVLWLTEDPSGLEVLKAEKSDERTLVLLSKDDEGNFADSGSISSSTGKGIGSLTEEIAVRLNAMSKVSGGSALITRERHRSHLGEVVERLNDASRLRYDDIDLKVENLRLAATSLGKITGLVDVEDLLDVIFSEFCVGK